MKAYRVVVRQTKEAEFRIYADDRRSAIEMATMGEGYDGCGIALLKDSLGPIIVTSATQFKPPLEGQEQTFLEHAIQNEWGEGAEIISPLGAKEG